MVHARSSSIGKSAALDTHSEHSAMVMHVPRALDQDSRKNKLHPLSTSFLSRWNLLTIYRVSRALRAQNPKKVRKMSPKASGRGTARLEKVWKSLESLEKVSKRPRQDSFETFPDSWWASGDFRYRPKGVLPKGVPRILDAF